MVVRNNHLGGPDRPRGGNGANNAGAGVDMRAFIAEFMRAQRVIAEAQNGDADAQLFIGRFFYSGGGGILQPNYEMSARYFGMAAEQGNAEGQYLYGICLKEGIGVAQNLPEAARYYRLSADQGNLEAMYDYAGCLIRGSGVPADPNVAFQYIGRAAERGHLKSLVSYSLALFEGVGGVQADMERAVEYLARAMSIDVRSTIERLEDYVARQYSLNPEDPASVETARQIFRNLVNASFEAEIQERGGGNLENLINALETAEAAIRRQEQERDQTETRGR
ncbi:MAG: hypothetical protein LBG48_05555 [Rickettsiales bacterium]|nr:hypothetical protein [Rickettsiales bacterium]